MEMSADHGNQFLQSEMENWKNGNSIRQKFSKTYAATLMDFKDDENRLNSTAK